ncbi:uncharacterized protein LOC129591007 isoform X1 [Paramacrobiotus metropolitanus]|uniref:uncharacterized protein LOC129591007 isoform X1 n=1 Tax=Paramacrobiotus metropolitanus TaxID=2943436 RepID=UPI002445E701|nr:uncharacterized protein LOC129591007 isoform X1 [Paramacrobiotus metropolitanus]
MNRHAGGTYCRCPVSQSMSRSRLVFLVVLILQTHALFVNASGEVAPALNAHPKTARIHKADPKDLRCICGETSIFCCLLANSAVDSSNGNRKIPKLPKPTAKPAKPQSSLQLDADADLLLPARTPWAFMGCQLDACRDRAGVLPHTTSCVHFINCWNSCGWLQICPPPLVFDEKSRSCEWPSRLQKDDPCYAASALQIDGKKLRRHPAS